MHDVASPFAWGDGGFDPTAAMDALTFAQIDHLSDYLDNPQRVLFVREMERQGLEFEGRPLNMPDDFAR